MSTYELQFFGSFFGKFWRFPKIWWSCLCYYWWFPRFSYPGPFPFVCVLGFFLILLDAGFNFIEVSSNFWSAFVFYDLIIFCCIIYFFVMSFIYFIKLNFIIVNVCSCEVNYRGIETVGSRFYIICIFGRY